MHVQDGCLGSLQGFSGKRNVARLHSYLEEKRTRDRFVLLPSLYSRTTVSGCMVTEITDRELRSFCVFIAESRRIVWGRLLMAEN
mgnify:CR=1 FL=1